MSFPQMSVIATAQSVTKVTLQSILILYDLRYVTNVT